MSWLPATFWLGKPMFGGVLLLLTRLPHEKLGGSSTRVPSHIGDPLALRSE